MDSHKVSLLKCTTTSETLVMHRTTFLCLSLVTCTTPNYMRGGLWHHARNTLHPYYMYIVGGGCHSASAQVSLIVGGFNDGDSGAFLLPPRNWYDSLSIVHNIPPLFILPR